MPCVHSYFPPNLTQSSLSQQQAKSVTSFAFEYFRNSRNTSNLFFSPLCFTQALSLLRYDYPKHSDKVWRIEDLIPDHIPVVQESRQELKISSDLDLIRLHRFVKAPDSNDSSSEDETCQYCNSSKVLQQKPTTSCTSIHINEEPLPPRTFIHELNFSAFWRPQNVTTTSGKFFYGSDRSNSTEMLCFKGQSLNYACSRVNPSKFFSCQVVELPFENDSYSAIIVLPPKNRDVRKALKHLDPDMWKTFLSEMKPRNIELVVPRFKLEEMMSCADAFENIGFENLAKCAMKHSCSLFFTENGINVGERKVEGKPSQEKEPQGHKERVAVDRPFFLVIRERHHGAILFMAIVENPLRIKQE